MSFNEPTERVKERFDSADASSDQIFRRLLEEEDPGDAASPSETQAAGLPDASPPPAPRPAGNPLLANGAAFLESPPSKEADGETLDLIRQLMMEQKRDFSREKFPKLTSEPTAAGVPEGARPDQSEWMDEAEDETAEPVARMDRLRAFWRRHYPWIIALLLVAPQLAMILPPMLAGAVFILSLCLLFFPEVAADFLRAVVGYLKGRPEEEPAEERG